MYENAKRLTPDDEHGFGSPKDMEVADTMIHRRTTRTSAMQRGPAARIAAVNFGLVFKQENNSIRRVYIPV